MTIDPARSIAPQERTDTAIDAARASTADFADALLSSAGKAIASESTGRNGEPGRRKDDQKETVRRAKAVTDPTAIASAALATHAAPKATTQAAEAAQRTPDRSAQADPKPQSRTPAPASSSPRAAPPPHSESAAMPTAKAPNRADQAVPHSRADAKVQGGSPTISPSASVKVAMPDTRARAADAVQALGRLVPQATRGGSSQAIPNRSPLRLEVAHGAQRATAAKPAAAPRATPKPEQPEEEFSAQISKGFAAIMRQNGGSLTLHLQPEALGDMTIRMDLQPGKVAAAFEVESDQARKLLDGNLTALRSALEAKGLSVDSLTVQVSERPAPEAQPTPAESGVLHDGGAGNPGGGAAGHGAGSGGGADGDHPSLVAPARSATDQDVPGMGAGETAGGALSVCLVLDAIA